VIAGPCSAETEDQVLKIAHELKDSDVSVFRAGMETKNSSRRV
jgi:chorismate mutase